MNSLTNFQRNTQKRLIQIEIQSATEVIKLFSYSTQLSTKFILLIKKLKYQQMKKFLAFSLSDVVFIRLINVKMPTIVGILTFMSSINSILS